MAADDDLVTFVRLALERGTSRPLVADTLQRAGWQRTQVQAALGAFADLDFPIPVPRPKRQVSAREAFLYLVLFTTLYIAAVNLGQLAFLLIERVLPDPAATWQPAAEYIATQARWAVAALVVSLPVFFYVSALTTREAAADPERRTSAVRRWLTYLTLFNGAAIVICDLMTLVYYLLGGELTVRFVLKAAVVGAIAGGIFSYYLWDMRGDEAPRS